LDDIGRPCFAEASTPTTMLTCRPTQAPLAETLARAENLPAFACWSFRYATVTRAVVTLHITGNPPLRSSKFSKAGQDLRHETRRAHRVNRTSGAKGVANGKEFTTCSAGSRAAEAIQSAAALSATNKAVVRRRSVPSATNVASAPHGAAPDLTFRRPGYADTIDPGPAGSTSHGNLRSQLGTLKRGKRHGLNGI